jgi:tetratricopeptide (TPR) repeat protein
MSFGNIYLRLSYCTDCEANALRAIEAFTRAMGIYTKDTYPIKYGRAVYNKSTAYSSAYAAAFNIQYLELAKETSEESLKIFNKENFPLDYALGQNHLATVYAGLLDKTGSALYFTEAIKAYDEALLIHDRDEYPFYHGRNLHNRGELYRKYASSSAVPDIKHKTRYLKFALDYFDQALEIRTAEDFLQYYCITQLQKGRACIDLAKFEDGEGNFNNAIKVFDETIQKCPDIEQLTKGRLYNNKALALEGLFDLSSDKSYLNQGIEAVQKGLQYAGAGGEKSRMEKDLRRMKGKLENR